MRGDFRLLPIVVPPLASKGGLEVAGTPAPIAREELERLVHDYRHARDEHRHARRGGRRRRRVSARLREIEARFEHVLATAPLEDATRQEWRDHLHHQAPAPNAPPSDAALALARGAADHWPRLGQDAPISLSVQGGLHAGARDDLERTLARLARLDGQPDGESVAEVGAEMRKVMQTHCGVVRFPDLLAEGVTKIREVAERAGAAPERRSGGSRKSRPSCCEFPFTTIPRLSPPVASRPSSRTTRWHRRNAARSDSRPIRRTRSGS